MSSKKRVCVVGAGVIGLSTAVRIQQESAGWDHGLAELEVTVLADRFSPNTTSDGSGGFWEPYSLGDTPSACIRKWSEATWKYLLQLATSDTAAIVGAQFVSGYTLCDSQTEMDPSYVDTVLGYRRLTPQELRLFPFARWGSFHTSLQINVRLYLPWLMKRFRHAGGKVEFGTLQDLSEVANAYDVVVNCCGPRAGLLVSDTDTVPIRGQVRRVRAPWVKHFYVFDSSDGPISYVLPLGEEVVVGGVAQRGNWKEKVDPADSEDIWTRATALFPLIKDTPKISEWAGIRPGRTTVRLEAETLTTGGKSIPVVHNYGHGGAGVTLHWGCAADAARLVHAALLSTPTRSML